MRAWVEFPCETLQAHVYLQGVQHGNQQNNSSHNGESSLSVKLIVSIELPPKEQRKSSSSTTARTVASKGSNLCVRDMKLTYFNETEQRVMRYKILNMFGNIAVINSETLLISFLWNWYWTDHIVLFFWNDRLNWKCNGDNEDDNNKLIISSEECVEVAFAAA